MEMTANFRLRPVSTFTFAFATAFVLAVLGAGCGGDDDDDDGDGTPIPPGTTQVLDLADASGSPGDTVAIAVSLENSEPLLGFQFDLVHDLSVLSVIDAESTTRTSGFDVFGSIPEVGLARIVVADLGGSAQIAAGSGPVLTVVVAVAPGAAPGASVLATSEARGTNASSTSISLGSSEGTFTVD